MSATKTNAPPTPETESLAATNRSALLAEVEDLEERIADSLGDMREALDRATYYSGKLEIARMKLALAQQVVSP